MAYKINAKKSAGLFQKLKQAEKDWEVKSPKGKSKV